MIRNDMTLSLASIFIVAMAWVASGDARAATWFRGLHQNPTGVCQSALPVYDGQIRKRPKAIQNEGSSPAFVTCSWSLQNYAADGSVYHDGGPYWLKMNFSTTNGQPGYVQCTAILGSSAQTLPQYIRGTDLHSNGTQRSLTWTAADFGATDGKFPSALVNVSCVLNPGVGINDSTVLFQEETGA